MIKRIYTLLAMILIGICCNTILGQSVLIQNIDHPEKKGFSKERLQRIDKAIQQYVDSGWISGAIALIARDGNIVYHKALGYDDRENNKLLSKDAIFRIASQTKAITSTAVMMLYEEGKFLLDDPISKYIPEFAKPKVIDKFNQADSSFTTVPAAREVTIRDLLTHTSGIGYAQIGDDTINAIYAKAGIVVGWGVSGKNLADNIKKLASLPLLHQPGRKWTYGLNVDVLGYLVEKVSGMSLSDFLRKRIFEPLGMKDTYFSLPKEKWNRLAMLHTEDSTKHTVKMPEHIQINGDFYRDYPMNMDGYFAGGSGLVSTAYDYAIFLQMLLNGGAYNGKRLLSPFMVRMMTQSQTGEIDTPRNTKFGFGFELVTEKNAYQWPYSIGSFYWGGMFGSSYWVDPKEKIVAQFVLQKYPNSYFDVARKFRVLVYQALCEP